MMNMVTAQIKKVPKPPMIKMWNWGNLIGANMTIKYPENPGSFQINEFPIHEYIEKDRPNMTYEDNQPNSTMKLTGHEEPFELI